MERGYVAVRLKYVPRTDRLLYVRYDEAIDILRLKSFGGTGQGK